jgi:hypothetical protein
MLRVVKRTRAGNHLPGPRLALLLDPLANWQRPSHLQVHLRFAREEAVRAC